MWKCFVSLHFPYLYAVRYLLHTRLNWYLHTKLVIFFAPARFDLFPHIFFTSIARSVMNIKWIYVNQSKSHFSCYLCASDLRVYVSFIFFHSFTNLLFILFFRRSLPSTHRLKCRIFLRIVTNNEPRNFPVDSSSSSKHSQKRRPRLLLRDCYSLTILLKRNISCFVLFLWARCDAVRFCVFVCTCKCEIPHCRCLQPVCHILNIVVLFLDDSNSTTFLTWTFI